ncbi:uncharacterized protein LOC129914358 [Episyrphus balteatus]|uniref:uncharacterized protein LOC129914358 n=1 Tax=Episyrphus balteatus TaxID=286459 RepID=UPI0024850F95|nr:uncharacterized protein LOC129914358 [Episyrphus balteatus]
MSRLRNNEDLLTETPSSVLVISDSDDSGDELTGFSSPKKRLATVVDDVAAVDNQPTKMEPPLAKKKLKIDGEPNEEPPIDIDSVSTNPMRTRTKVSSDTSSKFPVSSPSDTVPLAGHRKKYVKNTLPAGAEWRMLQEIALGHPAITYREKLAHWVCRDELSDVEDVNNFDAQFQKREQFYARSLSGRRSVGKDSPYPNYNYNHFRSVILETFRTSPVGSSQESARKSSQSQQQQPSCSREAPSNVEPSVSLKPDSNNVTIYEKILCPSSESSATKASPSIRLHWTDDESVFRCNRLNPDIDKYSQLIKVRIDYNKQIDFKAKINEIFKTPTVPMKYNSPPIELVAGKSNDDETKSLEEQQIDEITPERKIQTRRSTEGKSVESRRSSERKSSERRSSDRRSSDRRSNERQSSERFPEVNCFQQDEFCNYLGLGMNGKVYSPTPTDNKRRSLRVKRLLVQTESMDKKKSEKKKELNKKKKNNNALDQEEKEKEDVKQEPTNEEHQNVTNTEVNEIRCSLPEDTNSKPIEEPVIPKSPEPIPTANLIVTKTPEIKIITQLRNTATPTRNTPSSVTTANSTPPPTTTRRQRRTRATSNGTSTCPRSSQSDESPEKSAPRRRRLNHHSHPDDHASDFLSESLQSDPSPPNVGDRSPQHNGRTSTVPSSEDKKDEHKLSIETDIRRQEDNEEPECVHKKYQRYLEESRKTKPSIFIVESINSSEFKPSAALPINYRKNMNTVIPKEASPKERKIRKTTQEWPSNKIVLRHLLRRNGTVVGTFNQRILRNRTAMITKHQKVKAMKKKVIRMHLNKGKDNVKKEELGKKKIPDNHIKMEITKKNKASQIDIETKKEMQSSFSQVDDDDPVLSLSKNTEVNLPKAKETCKAIIQTDAYVPPLPITFLSTPSERSPNPLTPENGRVIYAYYELDILTIVQDFMVTFWKTCKLIEVVGNTTEEWVQLGECKRLLYDTEIDAPYKNRICVHNSIPIYMEMRAKELPQLNRDCVLISVYVNVYYYHDEDLVAKSHSIQLDTVASHPQNVVFTTITDSRYFVMCWSQETHIGKTLSGLCKYSLTPHLDTLASIREFKSMRHEIRYLECTTDDNLIGFGDSQVTLWDHRSGDILMNYDLDMAIGNNVGSLHFPPLEVGQAKTVLIFQKTSALELSIIAINVSHNAPSHQLVCKHILPPEFDNLKTTMGIDDYTILTNSEHQELWIDHSDPQYMVQIKTPEGQKRFYSRCKQNVVVITENHLALETFSSFVLKMSNLTDI